MQRNLRGAVALLATAAVLALAPLDVSAGGVPLDAPLGAPMESPLRLAFLELTGADARPPAAPRVAVRWVVANSWSTPTTLVRGDETAFLQLDAESEALALSVIAPWRSLWPSGPGVPVVGALVRRLTTSLEARGTVWWGGWSDVPVEGWHGLIGFTNFEREDHASGRIRLRLGDPDATVFEARSTNVSFGGVVLRNQLLLAEGGASLRAAPAEARSRWAVSLRLDAKLPFGSSRLGASGSTDVGAGILATAELTRWLVLHGNVSTAAWGDYADDVALQPRRFHHGAELTAVLVGKRWALVVEDRLLSPVFPSGWKRFGDDVTYQHLHASATFAATRWHNQISVGVRRGLVTVWFAEDFTLGRTAGGHWFYNSNAPDIALGVEVASSL